MLLAWRSVPSSPSRYQALRGGEILGLPLGEAYSEGEMPTQRFENGILEVHNDLPDQLAIQLAPLGLSYSPPMPPESGEASPAAPPTALPQSGGPVAHTWVGYPILEPESEQRIYIEVLRPDGSPWSGIVPLVRVAGPQGAPYPTGAAEGAP